jgi:tripartite-type tricarboxylate transporter receptor subunit TctC
LKSAARLWQDRGQRCGSGQGIAARANGPDHSKEPIMRLILAMLASLAAAMLAPRSAAALDYPTRAVHVIIPFTAGGAPDVLFRVIAQKLSDKWGQPVVVDNRAGGNTLIGTLDAVKSAPDGYTLFLTADQTFVLNPLLYSKLPYSMKQLEPIILVASVPHMLAVSSKVPVSNVKELVALAKANPGKITYGTTGPGTIQRIATEYFSSRTGVKLLQVPYKGANETTVAILAGEIDMTINGMSNILPHIGSGKLKALAITTTTRNPLAPNVPTMQEAGVPGYSSKGSFGLFAPTGTPQAIIDKVDADTAAVLAMPDVKKTLEARSFVVDGVGPKAFQKFIADETVKWRKVINEADIHIN